MPRLFRLFFYGPRDQEGGLSDRFARVLDAVGRPGQGCSRLLFHLGDSPVSRASAVDRILRAFPETEQFLYRASRWPGPFKVLSNYAPPWTDPNPNRPEGSLAPERLEAILEGVPRRFPLFEVGVIFDGVDWAGTGRGLAAGPAQGERDPVPPADWGYLFPSVSLLRRRAVECHATVECDDPGAELGPIVTEKLERVGRSRRQDVRAGFAPDELDAHRRRKTEAKAIVTTFEAQLGAWLVDRVHLPHEWPPTRDRPASEARFSLKTALLGHFRAMGYRPASQPSGSATFSLCKATPRHHVLQIWADRGTWSRTISCQFRFLGLDTIHAVDLPAGAGRQYPAGDQAQVDRVVANWAAVVEGPERDLVPRLEDVYGDGVHWLPAIQMGRGPRRREP